MLLVTRDVGHGNIVTSVVMLFHISGIWSPCISAPFAVD